MTTLEIKSDFKNAENTIKSAIHAEIKRLEIALSRTLREIKKFEDKYKISSEMFVEKYTADDLERGDDEYISWMGEIKIKDRISEELNNLKEIEYVTV